MYGLAVEMKQFTIISIIAGLGLAASACGGGTSVTGVDRTVLAPAQATAHTKLVSEGDALWAKRGEAGNAKAAIDKWEEAIKLKASDWETCGKLSRAYHFAAGGWLSLQDSAPRKKMHRRGFEVADQGLKALSPQFERLRKQGSKIHAAAAVIERDGIPLVYWYAANLGAYAYASGMEGLKYKTSIEKLIAHVYKIERPFNRHSADHFMAAFFAAAPPFLGGNMQQADEHFGYLAKHAPNNMSVLLLKARFYAPRKKDKKMFVDALNGIINAKPCSDPNPTTPCMDKGFEPEAELEKPKARKLLLKVKKYFN